MSTESKYRCGKHGLYEPDFNREYDGEICPRIMCLECETESLDSDPLKHPRNVPYFYNDELKVILQEAHRLSGVWKFNPPIVYPEFTFAKDLNPIVPEGALTSEEIMSRMEELLPEVELLAKKSGINVDPKDLLMLPGRSIRVRDDSS